MLDNLDEVKQALNIDSIREVSGPKIMELVELMQSGRITEAGKVALFAAAPELITIVADAMNDTNEQVVHSNDQSSANLYEHFKQSKEFWARLATDPNTTEEERRDARDRYERVDELIADHDIFNKQFNLELVKNKKEILLTVTGLLVVSVGGLAFRGKIPLPR